MSQTARVQRCYRRPMSDENLVVVGILVGIVAMIVVLVRYQRGKERRLAAAPAPSGRLRSFGRIAGRDS